MAIIGVDIDLTVVASDLAWWDWCNKRTGQNLSTDKIVSPLYDISKYYAPMIDYNDFWRQRNLYDDMVPIKDSVEVLEFLKNKGHEIVFISRLKGDHHKSKVNFIKKYFPFYDGIIGTHEKKYAKVDMLIDDRLDNLYSMDDNVIKVLYATPYKQNENNQDRMILNHYHMIDWKSGYLLIMNILR